MQKDEARSPSSELRCVLCKRADETEITGALSCKQGTAAHQNCLLYASGIYCKNSPTYDDLFGFDVEDVEEERRRGRKLKCHHCGENGATAGCEVKSCRRSYHYPCAHMDRARSEDDGSSFRLYCAKHDPRERSVDADGKEREAKAIPSTLDWKRSETNEQDNSLGGSECDSETPGRSQSRKRRYHQSVSDSDETQSIIDMEMAPIESEFEDNTPPDKSAQLDSEPTSKDYKKQREGVDFAAADEVYRALDFESQSLLEPEYHQEDVPFTVIADSGPSTESFAENSPDPFSSAAPSPADLHSNITIPPNPHVPANLCLDSLPSGTTGESGRVKVDLCEDLAVRPERCASRDLPPQMSFQNGLLGLTSPRGCSMAHSQSGVPVGHVDVLDSAAALFWRRCNEVGFTEAIFAELTRQLSGLAERVKSPHATQQDYDVSLGILKASGRLPAIINQMEQDMEHQEKQLQRKRRALSDAKAVLIEKRFI